MGGYMKRIYKAANKHEFQETCKGAFADAMKKVRKHNRHCSFSLVLVLVPHSADYLVRFNRDKTRKEAEQDHWPPFGRKLRRFEQCRRFGYNIWDEPYGDTDSDTPKQPLVSKRVEGEG